MITKKGATKIEAVRTWDEALRETAETRKKRKMETKTHPKELAEEETRKKKQTL